MAMSTSSAAAAGGNPGGHYVEVTRSNFGLHLPAMLAAARGCAFASVDTEFTALDLVPPGADPGGFFTTLEERYAELKHHAGGAALMQIGLAFFFKGGDGSDGYRAETYNVQVFPRSFGNVNDAPFACQPSSLAFMASKGANLNSFICDGVGHLNGTQEAEVWRMLEAKGQFGAAEAAGTRSYTYTGENDLLEAVEEARRWAQGAKEIGAGGTMGVVSAKGVADDYLLHQAIRREVKDVWTVEAVGNSGGAIATLFKVSAAERARQEKEYSDSGEEEVDREAFMERLLGLSRVFRALSAAQKTLVGHNALKDLAFIYRAFIDELPPNYRDFKAKVHAAFPLIYDTKYLTRAAYLAAPRSSPLKTLLAKTSLEKLSEALEGLEPRVLAGSSGSSSGGFHQAGYDALATGTCFVRAARLIDQQHGGSGGDLASPALDPMANCVSVMGASADHLVLDGPDPNPQTVILVLRRKGKGPPATVKEAAGELAGFNVREQNVRPLSGSRNVFQVATPHPGAAKWLLYNFSSPNFELRRS